jgi:hypothetical protein
MFAEVANYANDAGMLIFLVTLAVFAPLAVPRGSDLPSGSFACIREMMYSRATRYTQRGRHGSGLRETTYSESVSAPARSFDLSISS